MRVHLIKKQSIQDFYFRNPRSKKSFEFWLTIIKNVDWETPLDIIVTFNKADILGKSSNRVVFDIAGNYYRMICKYHFGKNKVHLFVKWIGTHADYTKICNEGRQYSINAY